MTFILITGATKRSVILPPLSFKTFSTTFSDAPENPISEGGAWSHTSNAWANIATLGSPNRAVGTQAGGSFNDSYAYLSGFRPDCSAMATVYVDPTIDTSVPGEHEIEMLFRVADGPSSVRAYECNFNYLGNYSNMVRWNGALNDFDFLALGNTFSPLVTGDQVMSTCQTVAGVVNLNSYVKFASGSGVVNGVSVGAGWNLVSFATDSVASASPKVPWFDGQPGLGMWLQDASKIADEPKFGATTYSATEI